MRTRTITSADGLDAALVLAIAAGQPVAIAPGLAAEVDRRCDQARAVLRDGAPVYGVNTGMGALVGVRLTGPEQRAHQRNLLLARATGGPPWLDAADTRALIAVHLRTFLSGDSGVSAGLCQRLVDLLGAGIVPAVPRTGAGCAGEIIPLAHAFGPLAGIGRVLTGDGGTRPAGDALREHGMAEFDLGPREGHALLTGVPGATALCLRRGAEAAALAALMEAAAALSIAAVRASRDPYGAACARGDGLLGQVLGRLRAAIGEEAEPGSLQAPVSFRVAGPVLAHVHRAGAGLAAAADRALAGVTDSPAFLDGRFTGTAGFHGIDLAAHCDQLTAAFAHAAEVSAARCHRLLDPRVTGLPAQLASRPGPEAGLVAVHKRAAGETHALRRLATATPVGLIETSGGQEDVQSFAWEAAENLRAALRHARAVTACELLTAYQAHALSGRPAPSGCRPVLDRLESVLARGDTPSPRGQAPGSHGPEPPDGLEAPVTSSRAPRPLSPVLSDRPFGEDIERLMDHATATIPPSTRQNDR
jgi:histidine ammonia-lyase